MVYVSTAICEIVYLVWSYFFLKNYQLLGYNIKSFLVSIYSFQFGFGDKNKLVWTKRMTRFIILYFILSTGLFFLVNYFVKSLPLVFLNYIIIFIFAHIFIVLVHFLLLPLELLIKKYYIAKARRKLEKLNVIKIGITGSYGKTSTKNILTCMLEKEFKVCTTPKNYNTEMGLTKTILNNLDDHDILIAEMGARHVGDIKALTKIVQPNYAVLTTIGKQHIETFKSIENIEKTKFELAENVAENGIVIFNGDSPSNLKLYKKYKGIKYLTCDEKGFCYAKNIKIDTNGSNFDLIIDKQTLKVSTKLLGKGNIDNIVTSACLAYLLGIKNNDLISAIKMLEPTPHRLQLINNNYMTIIDDSYNSNLTGASQALEVLSMFDGQKIVVTPGLVEMGIDQSEANFMLGTLIADVADYIIIMNEINKNYILSGAISHNFDKNKIYFCSNRKKQKELLQLLTTKDCVVLFENDLPDNYK